MEEIKEKQITGADLSFYFLCLGFFIFQCASFSPNSSSREIVFQKTMKLTRDQKILNGVFFFLAFPLTVQVRIYGSDG